MFFPLYDENPTSRWPVITMGIIAANLLPWLHSQTLSDYDLISVHAQHGFIPRRVEQLYNSNLIIEFDIVPDSASRNVDPARVPLHEYSPIRLEPHISEIILSIFTSMFLHAGFLHFAGNMWIFWIYGNNIEDRLGHLPFLMFYLGGGLAASLCQALMIPSTQTEVPLIGASGAVATILGAYVVTYPKHFVRCLVILCVPLVIRLPALVVLGFWIFFQVLSLFNATAFDNGGNVAWWAHVGGFVVGAGAMPLLCKAIPPPPTAALSPRPSPLMSAGLNPPGG